MDAAGAESTQDWLLPERSRPPTVAELERRIEEALATARASEAAVMTVGAAAFDAAEQARRAAELAERASAAVALATSDRPRTTPTAEAEGEGEGLRDFSERADRLVARLRQLQRIPLAEPAASDASDR
ncbi:MAG TPA: hypothetical protein VNL97_01260 [Solirubrobacterales bacterium]|nr:hypothetical protein [Solirubrobacterales bacterium]